VTDYLRNTWYMFGWEEELGEGLLSRKILDQRIVAYRKSDGSVVAMRDRCPHRFAPLSMGQREGDRLVCGYHGLTFDSTGACVRNAFAELIPPNCRVATFPAACRDSAIWLWMGPPKAADEALIPDLSFLRDPGHHRSVFHVKADYRVITDNLMDLSHIEFVHRGSFGGQGVIFQGKLKVLNEGRKIRVIWEMNDIEAPAFAKGAAAGSNVDHWLDMHWTAPAAMALEVGLTRAGVRREEGLLFAAWGAHILTPETSTTSHYFYTAPNAPTAEELRPLEHEDKPFLEAVQTEMGTAEFWSLRPVILSVDAGAVRVRRRLAKMIADENRQQHTPSSDIASLKEGA
jgi:nitrite reductase/ring-hydroxylating ferredoxin subunit